jgi:hypothetical protein
MAKKNVADVLVDTLVARGVERIYGVAGGLAQRNHGFDSQTSAHAVDAR